MSASLAERPAARAAVPDAARKADPPLALVTLTVMLGLIMAIIDTSIVNVALNDMAGTLGASLDEIGWVATGYILANVIIMPLNGWLTARFGRRNFYATCLVLFTVSSFLCGTATSVGQLIVYRVIQGFGGGALQPTAQAILFESYPPNKRAGAMAIFGLGAMVGPAIGPTLGGIIVDNFSWPLIFFINIPIGIVAFFMTLAFIRDPAYVKRDRSPVDLIGLGLLTAGVASVQYVLERGQREDWFQSSTIDVLSVVAIAALVIFCVRELRDPFPLVDLRVFKSRAFSAGSLIGVVSGFGLFGTALILPLFFQNVMGFTATQTGMALLPGAIATAISMPIASRLVAKIDGRLLIAAGLTIFAIGAWWMGGLTQEAGLLGRLLAALGAGLRARVSVRSALDGHARRDRARANGERDGDLHARPAARRLARNRRPAVPADAVSGQRVRDARLGRNDREPRRRAIPEPDARHGDAALANGDGERDGAVVRRRAAAVRDRLHRLDPAGVLAEMAPLQRRGRARCRDGRVTARSGCYRAVPAVTAVSSASHTASVT